MEPHMEVGTRTRVAWLTAIGVWVIAALIGTALVAMTNKNVASHIGLVFWGTEAAIDTPPLFCDSVPQEFSLGYPAPGVVSICFDRAGTPVSMYFTYTDKPLGGIVPQWHFEKPEWKPGPPR